MCHLRAAVIAALFLVLQAVPAVAQDVTLTSRDGAVTIDGTLIGYDGEFYRLDTIYGVLTLDGTGVICTGPGCPDPEAFVAEIRIAGARSIGATLLPALVERFAAREQMAVRRIASSDDVFTYLLSGLATDLPTARISFVLGSSGDGFTAMIEDRADLMLSSREVGADEAAQARAAGLGDLTDTPRSRIIALDGVVPVVARNNPVLALSLEELDAVLGGQITTWGPLGGIDEPIVLHGLAESGAPEGAQHHADSAALVDAVARDPFAFGLTRFSEIGNARMLGLSGDCGFDLVASAISLKTEDYPLTAPLFIYTPARRLPKTARDFLRYLGTEDAQRVVRRAGFVDQSVEQISLAQQGERIANAVARAGDEIGLPELQRMIAVLATGERLSLSFRFQAGSTALDAQSRANVRSLARMLESGDFDGADLLFAGFSDGDGAADANRTIAMRRANAVRAAVREAAELLDRDRVSLSVDGFGEAMPMGCDDSELGRQVNRRVELWLRPAQR